MALLTATGFLVLLATAHVLKPEIDPSWRLISEYEIGKYGWVMTLAFYSLAISCSSLAAALSSEARSMSGRAGLALLIVVAAGLAVAARFTADPITQAVKTPSGRLHDLGGLLVIPIFPIAATLLGSSLLRTPSWGSARTWLRWGVILVWFGFFSFAGWAILIVGSRMGTEGTFAGWPNRLMMAIYAGWLIRLSHFAIKYGGASR